MKTVYGSLPIDATKKIVDIANKHDLTLQEFWSAFGKFMLKYYNHGVDKKKINSATKDMLKSYKDEHHSGYSHLVVTQCIMEFLSGKMSNKNKEKVNVHGRKGQTS